MLARRIGKPILIALATLCCSLTAWPQPLLGLRPSVTVEPEYPAGVFDLNVAPLCAEFGAVGSALELGWSFSLGAFVLAACAEGGATLFLREGSAPRIASHGGLSCIIGLKAK